MKMLELYKKKDSKTRKDLLIAASTLGLLVSAGLVNPKAQADATLALSNAVMAPAQTSLAQVETLSQATSSSVTQSVLSPSPVVQAPVSSNTTTSNAAVVDSLADSLAGSLVSSLAASSSRLVSQMFISNAEVSYLAGQAKTVQVGSSLQNSFLATKVEVAQASASLSTAAMSATTQSDSSVDNIDSASLMNQFAGGAFQDLTAHSFYMISHWVNEPERYTPLNYLYKGQILTDNFGTVNQSFEVLDYVNSADPASGLPDNGFQGGAFAPIINGKVDLSRIIVSYAALQARGDEYKTDFGKDALTAFETVMGGFNIYTDGQVTTEGQTITAAKYTEKIQQEYPNTDLMTTGLSLSGYLALSTGARLEIPAFTFVADDPTNSLTPEQNAFIQSHPSMFFNFRNAYDLILGAHGVNGTNSTRYYDGGFEGLILSHYQYEGDNKPRDAIQFNPDGSLSDPVAPVAGPLINIMDNLGDPLISAISDILTRVMIDSSGTTLAPYAKMISTAITSGFREFVDAIIAFDPNLYNLSLVVGDVTKTIEEVSNGLTNLVFDGTNTLVSDIINLVNLVGGVRPDVGTAENPTLTSLEASPITPLSLAVTGNTGATAALSTASSSSIVSSSYNQELSSGAFAGITAHQFYSLAKDLADTPRFVGQSLQEGEIVYENQDKTGQAFQVIYTVDSSNPADGYSNNGFEAAAFAPIVNGKADLSRIVVSLGGSNNHPETGLNSDYAKDAITDFETVVGGQTYYTDGTQVIQGQSESAKRFVESLKATFPSTQVIVTGYSLGGYLALSSGAQTESPVFCFEGDDPSNILTAEQLAFVHAHPTMYINNRNAYDLFFGAFNGDGMNAAHYYDGGFEGLFGSHYQSFNDVTEDPYKFNPDGSIADPVAPTLGPLLNSIATAPDEILASIGSILTKGIASASESNLLSPSVTAAVSAAEDVVATLHPLVVAANGPESMVGKVIGTVISAGKSATNAVVSVGGTVIHSVIDVTMEGINNALSFFGTKA